MKVKELFEEVGNHSAKEVRNYIKQYKGGSIESFPFSTSFPAHRVEKDGSIVFSNESGLLKITDGLLDEKGEVLFPLKGKVHQIIIASAKLTSFKNFPEAVGSGYNAKNYERCAVVLSRENTNLTSFEHFPKEIQGNISFELAPNLSYSKINQFILSNRYFACTINPHYKGPLLSFLKMNVYLDTNRYYNKTSKPDEKLMKAFKIINTYIKANNNDILACQDELIDNGLTQYAKL
jgi:hypothetical protein